MAFVFFAFACLGGRAICLIHDFAAGAAARFLFGDLALFGFAHARVGERAGARAAFIVGQGAQNDAGFRRGRRPFGGRGFRRFGLGALGRGFRSGRGLRLCLGWRADDAALHLFDHDLLAAAVAEALAHGSLLDAALERQRL